MSDGEYLSATEAANALGVSVQTLYVYVGRKGIRSQAIPGSRQRRYWKADVERVVSKKRPGLAIGKLSDESRLTLITENGAFYCGRDAAALAATATFEETAALLWGFPVEEVFTAALPVIPLVCGDLAHLLAEEGALSRATLLIPLIEAANPSAYDMSPLGMARTGADILRSLAALLVGSGMPATEPIHLFLARALGASPLMAEVIRRQLILSADHGFGPGSVAVRAIASTGVTPWRVVMSGLSVSQGRRPQMDSWNEVGRVLAEVLASTNPAEPILRRHAGGAPVGGFDSPLYPRGDPRAKALLSFFAEALTDDPAYQRLAEALDTAALRHDLHPTFALISQFVDRRLGLGPGQSFFQLGRAAGWIAHGIEQFQMGEAEHVAEVYTGPLPQ